ncbi:hypothetical protein TCAL_11380 [Tigriopus californicus]|uniref:Uncharacterized protein n=1 Tax=Tigriopus californicus TaxID=6832 RepID=A0A553NZQ7_TIGCA|nr:dTTP/UTP pyrophosphatase-like [Tigriopus californicus]TRY70929.1 hypothetical protein TCAL_11380 [Tigriopus californicus]|eukprot:TCALIF_11380-PA protein Name:"Similar to ASMTL N-acetylserotonin O-methyltransferase-like protein (Homo sapiens)" AED:0.43 eAED:0.43 QI:0/-1/0/1/-1/1/1/0/212
MLEPLREGALKGVRIVLASGSPRRSQILSHTGLPFEVCPSTAEENLDPARYADRPGGFATDTAGLKAREVAQRLEPSTPTLIIGSDTVVTLDNRLFGKPRDAEHAAQMLAQLSGRSHVVYTGVWLIRLDPALSRPRTLSFSQSTTVHFDHLSEAVIRAYVASGEPMDKAGGYGIQARGATLVQGINGDFFNVMGFPLHLFGRKLYELYDASP